MALTVPLSYQTDSTGFASLQFPSMAANQAFIFAAVGGYVQASAALPAAATVLVADANGMASGAATFTYTGGILGVFAQVANAAPVAGTWLHAVGADSAIPTICMDSFGNYSQFGTRRANGTKAAPTGTVANDVLALYGGGGYYTSASAAYSGPTIGHFSVRATETWTNAKLGVFAAIATTKTGGTTSSMDFKVGVLGTGDISFPNLGTTASAANAFLDSGASNNLLRSTSSSRYKSEIEPMELGIAENIVFGAKAVYFRSKCAADQCPSPVTKGRQSFYGFVAEDMAAIDPRFAFWSYPEEAYEYLEEWSQEERITTVDAGGNEYTEVRPSVLISRERVLRKDADRASMIPDGVQYDRLVVPLILVVQKQAQQIAELQKAIVGLVNSR